MEDYENPRATAFREAVERIQREKAEAREKAIRDAEQREADKKKAIEDTIEAFNRAYHNND